MKTIDISWRRYILPNIHNEGWKFVGIFAAVTALLAMMWEPLGWIGIALTIWCFYQEKGRFSIQRKAQRT